MAIGRDYLLSPNFTLGMLTRTDNRKFLDKNLLEAQKYLPNLTRLCVEVLEPVRAMMGSLIVSSCFRCKDLNNAIGGAKNSQHTVGEACDMEFVGATEGDPLKAAFNKIAFSDLKYSQAIYEFGSWIHIGVVNEVLYPGKKQQKLVASRVKGKTIYMVAVSQI
jgi:zinc D-Ala-D-Ala carboxypeptidase